MGSGRWFCVAAMLLAACGHPGKDLPAGSFERGMAEAEGGAYLDAVEDLRLFIRRNPTGERADDAQYQIGLARMAQGYFPVAAVEFEILRTDYPNSDLVDDAYYMEGMCYAEQVPDLRLEQSVTRRAVSHLQRYLREFPNGKHREEVEAKLDELNRHLDRKALASVELYRRLHRPQAAQVTLAAILEERPASPLRPEMLLLAGDLHRELRDIAAAQESWARLVAEYPEHPLSEQARKRLRSIGAVGEDGP
jgi:outer membrane protein assembly factor BamD